ncbi:hypothetical protein NLO413_0409 [Candidatus Neoehrlichia lotoris str. RAC413]|uniref:Uncharacterized protein n=1 Tax=Candidatus Neoehrlichia procyonis str. RAC413 TaxID=1359163 RepID=A0A0F3NLW1_9RICK|nr:hypothetical protein NLO413_0409 [Candidatus Neoehrlichia lotoris str. RAC413]
MIDVITITIIIHRINPGPPDFIAIAVPDMLPTPKLPPITVHKAAMEVNFVLLLVLNINEIANGNLNICIHFNFIDKYNPNNISNVVDGINNIKLSDCKTNSRFYY